MNRNTLKPHLVPPADPAIPPALDDAITRALNSPAPVRIPADFAARVAKLAVAQPRHQPRRLPGWGPRLALASGALITLAMFALAPHASPTLASAPFDAEIVLFAELAGLVLLVPRLLHHD